MKNVFYFSHINVIGGIEQFFAYLSEKYAKWDITIIYRTGDAKQIARLRKFVRVEHFDGNEIICDKVFFNSNFDIKPYVKAKEYNLVIHGDYKAILENESIPLDHPLFTKCFDNYYGVSKVACDSWTEITHKPCKLIYNPVVIQPRKKLLKLVYCGRLTYEKGGDLVNKLVKRLTERGIDFLLYVYSNKQTIKGKNVIYMNTRLDAGQFLNKDNFDYILIPSKHESYCYSLIQSLINGLSAVITPCPVFKELGADENNSITLAFDGANIDDVIDCMVNNNYEFSYTPKQDTWDEILASGTSNYEPHFVTIRALKNYYDTDMDLHVSTGEEYSTSEKRADYIVSKHLAVIV